MAAAPNQHRRQIAATKGAETMTRTRLLWAGLVAAVTTAVLVATPTLVTAAGISALALD